MAGGREHKREYLRIMECWRVWAGLWLLAAVAVGASPLFLREVDPFYGGLFFLLGAQVSLGLWWGPYFGMIANPDLDAEYGRKGKLYIYDWPQWAQRWWADYWHAYTQAHKHRSRESHKPGLATWIRFKYLFRWVPWATWPLAVIWIVIYLGMFRQDASHARLDNWTDNTSNAPA